MTSTEFAVAVARRPYPTWTSVLNGYRNFGPRSEDAVERVSGVLNTPKKIWRVAASKEEHSSNVERRKAAWVSYQRRTSLEEAA